MALESEKNTLELENKAIKQENELLLKELNMFKSTIEKRPEGLEEKERLAYNTTIRQLKARIQEQDQTLGIRFRELNEAKLNFTEKLRENEMLKAKMSQIDSVSYQSVSVK